MLTVRWLMIFYIINKVLAKVYIKNHIFGADFKSYNVLRYVKKKMRENE